MKETLGNPRRRKPLEKPEPPPDTAAVKVKK